MAATVNDRDLYIMGGTRTQAVTLPVDVGVSGNVTGMLNGVPVQDVIDAAFAPGSGDNTVEILENSGTTITVSSSTLFQMPGSGSGGTFIGGGGVFGKDSAGVTKFSLSASTGTITAEDAIISGTITVGSIIEPGVTVSGTPLSTIAGNADDGFTAFQDTVDFRVPGAPTNLPVIDSITASSSAVGSRDIKLTWTYTQGAIQADHFILYYLEGTTNPTTSSPILAVVDGASRDLTVSGVPMDKSYRVGIVAARNSAFGVQKTAIVNAWSVTGGTASIAYSVISGGPPATATQNFFTTSTSDPSGGADGDAHFNSATNVMWFKVSGTWRRGGTINASEITTGTLAAARIAANSITSDKINVSTLSAITANLGTVNAGSITGSATITISGQAKFDGSTSTSQGTYTLSVNDSLGFSNGLLSRATTGKAVHGISSSGNAGFFVTAGTTASAVVASATGSSGVGLEAIGSFGSDAIKANGDIVQVAGTSSLRSLTISSGTLSCGAFTTSSTSLVTNLNADMLDGLHSTSLCRTIGSHSGTAAVSSSHFSILTTVSGVTTSGSGSNITIAPSSDERLKQDIAPEPLGLDFISDLNPVEYRLKANPAMKYHGFIAQDVGPLISATDDCLYQTNPDGMLGVDYVGLIAPMVNAIKELKARVEYLEGQIA